jgi:hypothetical protein
MSKRPITSANNDFSEVLAFLQEKGIVPEQPNQLLVQTAKKVHGFTYSLILWRFRLRSIPPHGQVFVEEIASDALQLLPQIMMGYGKPAKLLTRGIIENTLRHLYFLDHPIEFQRMNREAKWFLTIDALIDYGKNHPVFFRTESRFDAFNQISSLYSDLSAGIHGRSVRDLEMRAALRKIEYDQSSASIEAEFVRRCAEASNFVLSMIHRERMERFQQEDRRIILRTMPTRARGLWREHE